MKIWIEQRQAVTEYGITYNRLRAAINRDELTVMRGKPGRATLISRVSLERWLKAQISLGKNDGGMLV